MLEDFYRTYPNRLECLHIEDNNESDLISDSSDTVTSPVDCLLRVMSEEPGLLVLRFSVSSELFNSELMMLCRKVKESQTLATTVLCILHSLDNTTVMKIVGAGADFLTSTRLEAQQLAPCNAETVISHICPNIVRDRNLREGCLFLCGARDVRLVLGSNRLSTLCETDTYRKCEYLKNTTA